jgi:hypothetical protein
LIQTVSASRQINLFHAVYVVVISSGNKFPGVRDVSESQGLLMSSKIAAEESNEIGERWDKS